jgi:hypothetical protein
MKNFGKNLKIQSKKRVLDEKDTFIDLIDIFDNCNTRTEELEGNFMFAISSYDEPFYIMIENLFLLYYGEWKTDIILWWIYDRFDDEGKISPIEFNDHDTDSKEEILVETPEQLWNFLKRIDKLKK